MNKRAWSPVLPAPLRRVLLFQLDYLGLATVLDGEYQIADQGHVVVPFFSREVVSTALTSSAVRVVPSYRPQQPRCCGLMACSAVSSEDMYVVYSGCGTAFHLDSSYPQTAVKV
jgi:hypothetical protein